MIHMEIQPFNLKKVIPWKILQETHIYHHWNADSEIPQVSPEAQFFFCTLDHCKYNGHGPAAYCQGTSEAWTVPDPCDPPACPARHSCTGKSSSTGRWRVEKFTQRLRETDGNSWDLMVSIGASEVGFLHNSFNILQ